MRRGPIILAAVLLAGCQGPPAQPPAPDGPDEDGAPDAAVPDGARSDAAAIPDAPTSEAAEPDAVAPDAGPPDASPPDAPTPDAAPDANPHNPYGIRLTDVSFVTLGTWLYGGRSIADIWSVGSGAAVGDLDGDGDLDVVAARVDDPSSGRPGGPTTILWNQAPLGVPGSFTMDAVFSAMLVGARAHGAALGDYDADGDLDLFVGCEGYDYLFENDGTGVFADVTVAAGVAGRSDDVSNGGFFADVNHDGMLDLYVTNHTTTSPPYGGNPRAENRLFLNLGDGTFEDVSHASATASDGSSQAALAFDLDGTGDLVIYVANDRFYIDDVSGLPTPELIPGDAWYTLDEIDDQGVPMFVNRADTRGVHAGRSSMGVGLADVDGDRTPDVYVTDWGEKELYLNVSPGSALVEAQKPYHVALRIDGAGHTLVSWGARFFDLDRDGLLELFVINGAVSEAFTCSAYFQLDHYLRVPARGDPFDDVTVHVGLPFDPICGGVEMPASGRGIAAGDLDGDGDDDMVVPGYVEPYRFYRNDTTSPHHAARVRLVGTVSSPAPIGALWSLTREDGTHDVRFRYAGGDTYSHSDGALEIGLGASSTIPSSEVRWPSGLVQRIEGALVVDDEVTVVEPEWLSLTARVVGAGDPPPILVYQPVDELGAPLGVAGAGRSVQATRSDGQAVEVLDLGDGTYVASLPHPGVVRRTTLTLVVDGVTLRPRPMISYR